MPDWDGQLPLGVVPVFVNAGAALLPAIMAAVASILSLLLRPRELWAACRARPSSAVGVFCGLIIVAAGVGWLLAGPSVNPRRAKLKVSAAAGAGQGSGILRVDWAALALQWMNDERRATSSSAAPAPAARGEKTEAAHATILGGGPLRNGYAGGGSPIGLKLAWEFPAAGSPAAEELGTALFCGSPTVVDGAVYGGSCLYDAMGNYGTLFCLEAATGKPRWTTATFRNAAGEETPFKGFFSTPAISADGKYLVVGQGLHFDENCELVCLTTSTGRVHWLLPTPLHIEGSPAIAGDLVVAGAGAIERGPDHEVQGHAGLVVAARISTGEKLWEYALPDPESSPVIDRGMVYIGSGFHGHAVCALRTESDEALAQQKQDRLLWRTVTPYPATGAVTVTDDLVLIGIGNGDYVFTDPQPAGAVWALDKATGQVRWSVKLPDGVLGRIAVHGTRAIVPVRNGEIVALDLAAKTDETRILWRQRISGERAVLAGPAFTGTHVYAVSQDGWLGVLDARDGRLLERVALNATARPGDQGLSVSSPTIADGRVFVGSETGGLRCFQGQQAAE